MPTCFTLMPFARDLRSVFDAYQRACDSVGVQCYRIDQLARPGLITADILSAIAHADVLIADLTSRNANVFYELGIAQAAGKPVVITCRKGTKLPFDIAHHRVIFYDAGRRGLHLLRTNTAMFVKDEIRHPPANSVFELIHGSHAAMVTQLNV